MKKHFSYTKLVVWFPFGLPEIKQSHWILELIFLFFYACKFLFTKEAFLIVTYGIENELEKLLLSSFCL